MVQRSSCIRHIFVVDLQAKNMWNRVGVEPWGTFPGQVYLEGLFRIAMPGMFGLLMGYFGISSFLKARKISRS